MISYNIEQWQEDGTLGWRQITKSGRDVDRNDRALCCWDEMEYEHKTINTNSLSTMRLAFLLKRSYDENFHDVGKQ
jgi:hypothetical protein